VSETERPVGLGARRQARIGNPVATTHVTSDQEGAGARGETYDESGVRSGAVFLLVSGEGRDPSEGPCSPAEGPMPRAVGRRCSEPGCWSRIPARCSSTRRLFCSSRSTDDGLTGQRNSAMCERCTSCSIFELTHGHECSQTPLSRRHLAGTMGTWLATVRLYREDHDWANLLSGGEYRAPRVSLSPRW
jgi:hypothetical protein